VGGRRIAERVHAVEGGIGVWSFLLVVILVLLARRFRRAPSAAICALSAGLRGSRRRTKITTRITTRTMTKRRTCAHPGATRREERPEPLAARPPRGAWLLSWCGRSATALRSGHGVSGPLRVWPGGRIKTKITTRTTTKTMTKRRALHRGPPAMNKTPQLTLLGTGTPTPSLRRAGASYLVGLGDEKLLFDCGPFTVRRLLEKGVSPTEITSLFLTHLHYDHCVDYASRSRWSSRECGSGSSPRQVRSSTAASSSAKI